MNLLVVSYKVCWRDEASPSGFVSYGGFPQQIETLSELFDKTTLMILERRPPAAENAIALAGDRLAVSPLPEPEGSGLPRKLRFGAWLFRHIGKLWIEVGRADAVHALVPGDAGIAGILIARLRKKPLFIRHCGTWGYRGTLANKFLMGLLRRIAGGRTVVFATGGGPDPPEPSNPSILWIFSTSLRKGEFQTLPKSRPWDGASPLKLAFVGRLSKEKNAGAAVEALPLVCGRFPGTTLDIVGEGPEEERLRDLATSLGVEQSVRFHGNLGHQGVLDVLLACHLFLFPTRVPEGFPKAVLEAMACGLPVVAPPVSVLQSLIGHENGLLLDGTSPEDVSRAVLELAGSPDRMAERSASARKTAQDYSLETWRDTIKMRLEDAWGRPLRTRIQS